MRLRKHLGKPADNWLILPVARLKGGNSYEFALTAHAYSNSYTEQFEVKFGTEPTVEAMTASVIETSSVADSTPAAFSGHITPDADGLYYIGIHAVTPHRRRDIYTSTAYPSQPASLTAHPPLSATSQ